MDLQQAALAVFGVAVGYLWYKRYHASPISDVPGPKNPSWVHGNLLVFPRDERRYYDLTFLGQVTNGFGRVKRQLLSRRISWKNSEP